MYKHIDILSCNISWKLSLEQFARLHAKNTVDNLHVMLCGARNHGKSTYIRYLCNILLQKYPTVAILDADTGQTEFTPPGFISITLHSKPLLGPPTGHPVYTIGGTYIAGGTSPSVHPRLYIKALFQAYEKYLQLCATLKDTYIPLLINTAGWVTGLGLSILQYIYRYCDISHIVELNSKIVDISSVLTDTSLELCIGKPVSKCDTIPWLFQHTYNQE